MKKIALIIIGSILCAVGPLIVLVGTIYTLMLPNIYSSSAVIQITFPENTKAQYTEAALIALTKQKAVLMGQSSILYSVINELQLQDEWGRDGERLPGNIALKILKHSVHISANEQAVGLLQISVERDNPVEASEIANEIIMAYKIEYGNVSLVKLAEPNNRPVSPNLFMNVLFSVVLAIALMVTGVVLLISGIKKKKVQPA